MSVCTLGYAIEHIDFEMGLAVIPVLIIPPQVAFPMTILSLKETVLLSPVYSFFSAQHLIRFQATSIHCNQIHLGFYR